LYVVSGRARADILRIVSQSRREFGSVAGLRMSARLERMLEAISAGTAQGHLRRDVPRELGLRFEVIHPFVIAFRPRDRIIVRIVHGARDIRQLFGRR
jgi:plasmid stabilization system protein ParE